MHESGKLMVLAALEKGDSDKKTKLLFYLVETNETFFEPLDLRSTVQCMEFLDCFYPSSPEAMKMDPALREKFYSMLVGCRNGDLFLVSFFNSDPYRIESSKIFSFVRKTTHGNAELSSVKKVKAFSPQNSQKK